jgi:hypothetical protein
MATKPNPFARFEKSGKDIEVKGKGKEGSKREETFDKKQVGGKAPRFGVPGAKTMMKKGGKVKC